MPKISFIVDCDSEVGWGHFVRSHALAAELRGLHCDVDLLVNGTLPPFARPNSGVATELPSGTALLPWGVAIPDAIVLDLRTYSPATVDELPGSSMLIVLVDGPDPPFPTHLTVDANVSSEGTGHDTRLAGSAFVILRPEFDSVLTPRETKDTGTILVSFGGTDQRATLSHALDALDTLNVSPFRRTLVVAPATASTSATAAPSAGSSVSLLESVPDMPRLLLEVDAALITAGTLLYEACATGLPSASMSLNPEQHVEAQEIAKRGATLYLGPAEKLTSDDILAAMIRLGDAEMRATLSAHAYALVDGKGRRRVADEIVARLRARGRTSGR